MSDLDDKLTELLDNYEYGPDWQHDGQSTEEEAQTDIKRMVVAIKQAFKDAGYKDMHELYAEVVYWPKKAMTGQEWYDRFQDEVNRTNDLTVLDKEMKEQTAIGLSPAQAAISLAITKMNNAAKAAAGLE